MTIGFQPARKDLAWPLGDDLSVSWSFLDNGVTAHAWTGQTATMTLWTQSNPVVAAPVTQFTVALPTAGTLTAALTAAQLTTLGVGTYTYKLDVTTAGSPLTWIAGNFTITPYGTALTLESNAAFTINPSGVSISVALVVGSAVAAAANGAVLFLYSSFV